MNTVEVAALMKDWVDDVKKLAGDYYTAISKLDAVRIEYENAKIAFEKKWWVVYKNFIIAIVGLFIISGLVITVGHLADFCKISLSFPSAVSVEKCTK